MCFPLSSSALKTDCEYLIVEDMLSRARFEDEVAQSEEEEVQEDYEVVELEEEEVHEDYFSTEQVY